MSLARFIEVRKEYKNKQLLLVKHFVELEKDYEDELAVCQSSKKELQSLKDQLEKERSEHRDTAEALHYFRKKYKAKKSDLEKAEKVIEFYGNKSNWAFGIFCPQENDKEPFENKKQGWHESISGKKARQYFKEKQDQLKGEE